MKNIAVLMGDGVGVEIVQSAIKVLDRISKVYKINFNYEYVPIGGRAYEETGVPLPDKTVNTCLKSDAVLLGAVGDWKYDTLAPELRPEKALLGIRKKLNLFANLRPVKVFDNLLYASPLKPEIAQNVDIMIVRELTGDVYFGEPKGIIKKKTLDNREIKVGFNNMIYDEDEIERIAHVAFKSAQKRKKRVCCVDKANVLDVSRLFREVTTKVSKNYPDVELSYMYVDNAAMRMIQEPKFFDVMVTENTFGDILTDEGSCITGSMGLLPSASTGSSTPVFEPIHGSWPQGKGLNIANPLAQILSVAMLYEYFDLKEEGALIRKAVDASLDQNVRTPEIQVEGGAKYGTKEVGAWIVDFIKKA